MDHKQLIQIEICQPKRVVIYISHTHKTLVINHSDEGSQIYRFRMLDLDCRNPTYSYEIKLLRHKYTQAEGGMEEEGEEEGERFGEIQLRWVD